MLVLTRTVNQKICIGPDITITVVAIDHGRIRLGIDAPREMPIVREEVRQREENPVRSSASSSASSEELGIQ
jgi:carbon storage regulator